MPIRFDRRCFLAAGMGAAWLQHRYLDASDTKGLARSTIVKSTHVYKHVGDLEIKADVYRPDDDIRRAVVVWIHGGALINGHREGVSGRVKSWAANAGHCLVSIDYRLAPETQLPLIIEDVEDAFKWIHQQGPRLFQADTSRIAVSGGSAGGYLTLTTGHRVRPRPRVLIAFWGYGDLVGDWYSQPSPHARHQRIKMSPDEARAQVSGPAISDSRDRKGNGGAFYQHCRQRGNWPQAVSGWDPLKQAEKFNPYMPVKNVTEGYPPTVLIHGTTDTDVPYQQSTMMAEQFAHHGVTHQLLSVKDAEHGLAGGDSERVDEAYDRAFAFAAKHLS